MIPKVDVIEMLDGINELKEQSLALMINPGHPLPENFTKILAQIIILGDAVKRSRILQGLEIFEEATASPDNDVRP